MVLPSPPYAFPSARICYQPRLVRSAAARATLPPGVTLLSLLGWTLGGVFVVDWRASPVGPYREVAVLSGMVARDWMIGAWASHLIVTSDAAAEAGQTHWGLPAIAGSLELQAAAPAGEGAPDALLHFGSTSEACVSRWDGWTEDDEAAESQTTPTSRPFQFELPSLSGGLRLADGTRTPLLRYPLSISCRSLRLRRALRVESALNGKSELSESEALLRATLEGCAAAPCLQIDGASLVAGRALELRPGAEASGGGRLRPPRIAVTVAIVAAAVALGQLMPGAFFGNGLVGFEPSYFMAITRMLESGATGPPGLADGFNEVLTLGGGLETLLSD